MDNKNNELKEWDVVAKWELNHDKGIAKFSILYGAGNVISASFKQGLYFGEDGVLLAPEELDHILWFMSKMTAVPSDGEQLSRYDEQKSNQ